MFAVEGGDAVVRYGHAVGITAEIAEDMFGSAEGRLGIDASVLPLLISSTSCSNQPGSRKSAAGPRQSSRFLR